jgi:hypothetical protein
MDAFWTVVVVVDVVVIRRWLRVVVYDGMAFS